MFQIYSWPSVILHVDGDAFFASCIQATHPTLRNKPVVAGGERGIATAVSYEARALGITRGMTVAKIRKLFPQCVVFHSDYRTYHIFSQKMFMILRKYSPCVEEYSIDEAFADLQGMRRPLHMTYREIGKRVQQEIHTTLGITVSVGISLTKSLAKIASSHSKPSGFTLIPGHSIEDFLGKRKLSDIWGVGPQTASYLQKLGLRTALEFVNMSEEAVKQRLSKPYFEIWQELRGIKVYEVSSHSKSAYKSMIQSRTFPPTQDKDILWARLLSHIEDVFTRARVSDYYVGTVTIFLKTQEFRYIRREIVLEEKIQYPYLIHQKLKDIFDEIYQKNILYRTAGCILSDLDQKAVQQTSLFEPTIELQKKVKNIYPLLDSRKVHFGSALFDEQKNIEKKAPPLFTLPTLSLTDLG